MQLRSVKKSYFIGVLTFSLPKLGTNYLQYWLTKSFNTSAIIYVIGFVKFTLLSKCSFSHQGLVVQSLVNLWYLILLL